MILLLHTALTEVTQNYCWLGSSEGSKMVSVTGLAPKKGWLADWVQLRRESGTHACSLPSMAVIEWWTSYVVTGLTQNKS